MKGVQITKNNITPSLNRIQNKLDGLSKLAYNEFVKQTPVRSGNARRRTKLQNDTIVADYPYAKRLDEGYSKQSPQGMSKPTEEYIKTELDKIMRK
jgi:hypothetical protein